MLGAGEAEFGIVLGNCFEPGVGRLLQIARSGSDDAELDAVTEDGLAVELTVPVLRNDLDRALRGQARPVRRHIGLKDFAATDGLILRRRTRHRLSGSANRWRRGFAVGAVAGPGQVAHRLRRRQRRERSLDWLELPIVGAARDGEQLRFLVDVLRAIPRLRVAAHPLWAAAAAALRFA